MSDDTFVIIGAGLAGAKTAEALRSDGFTGRVLLIGDEAHRPYERPPLSKAYLAGTAARDELYVHAADWHIQHGVEMHLGRTAVRLDRDRYRVELSDGGTVDYDRLLVATGARPRRLTVPGASARGVHYLRTVEDSDALRALLRAGRRLVIIGAGWIGLEVAAAARAADVAVTVVESAALPLLRVLGPEIGERFAALHRANGVQFRFGASVAEIRTVAGEVSGVRLGDDSVLPADAVLVAIGAVPNAELAAAAGLRVDNGILVDAGLRSSDADVFAAGDVANAVHPLLGTRIRVEHWANALNQPAVAAAAMLDRPARYDEVPYFYTDQYALGMEYRGYVAPGGYDEVVVRGDDKEYIAFWLHEDRILAAMNVNTWDVGDTLAALVRDRVSVDPGLLADMSRPLDDLLGDRLAGSVRE